MSISSNYIQELNWTHDMQIYNIYRYTGIRIVSAETYVHRTITYYFRQLSFTEIYIIIIHIIMDEI